MATPQKPPGPDSRPGLGTLTPHLNLPQLTSQLEGGGRRRLLAERAGTKGPVGAREENEPLSLVLLEVTGQRPALFAGREDAPVVPSNAGKVASTVDAPASLQALPSMRF